MTEKEHGGQEHEAMFKIASTSKTCSARIGRLALPSRPPLQTPNYIAITSRGAVPHIAQDVLIDSTSIKGAYMALEDFIERVPEAKPPILDYKPQCGSSPLRRFNAFPDETLVILGARRIPPVTTPAGNSTKEVQIFTSTGFRKITPAYYGNAAVHLRPDVLIGLGDIPFNADRISRKRSEAMTDRTTRWMNEQIQIIESATSAELDRPTLFAPLLPLEPATQRWYLEELTDKLLDSLHGLAVYDTVALTDLPPQLANLPRLSLTQADTPQRLLWEISQGMDVFTIPFVGSATDAGIALDFTFPVQRGADESELARGQSPKPLGVDMWSDAHTTSVTPLSPGCRCYACTNHHRAYLNHLLLAKEMLGWVLLQVHNHHVMDKFFEGVRGSIGADTFGEDRRAFEREYESRLPEKTGQGPRVRGYQFKSDGPSEVKRNPAPFTMLNDQQEKLAETGESDPVRYVKDIAAAGLAEKV